MPAPATNTRVLDGNFQGKEITQMLQHVVHGSEVILKLRRLVISGMFGTVILASLDRISAVFPVSMFVTFGKNPSDSLVP